MLPNAAPGQQANAAEQHAQPSGWKWELQAATAGEQLVGPERCPRCQAGVFYPVAVHDQGTMRHCFSCDYRESFAAPEESDRG